MGRSQGSDCTRRGEQKQRTLVGDVAQASANGAGNPDRHDYGPPNASSTWLEKANKLLRREPTCGNPTGQRIDRFTCLTIIASLHGESGIRFERIGYELL
jgi:hypothetical protein